MLVLKTSSPKTFRRAPKNAPRMAVPSSRTRLPFIRWTLPQFPVRLLGFVSLDGERQRLSGRRPLRTRIERPSPRFHETSALSEGRLRRPIPVWRREFHRGDRRPHRRPGIVRPGEWNRRWLPLGPQRSPDPRGLPRGPAREMIPTLATRTAAASHSVAQSSCPNDCLASTRGDRRDNARMPDVASALLRARPLSLPQETRARVLRYRGSSGTADR